MTHRKRKIAADRAEAEEPNYEQEEDEQEPDADVPEPGEEPDLPDTGEEPREPEEPPEEPPAEEQEAANIVEPPEEMSEIEQKFQLAIDAAGAAEEMVAKFQEQLADVPTKSEVANIAKDIDTKLAKAQATMLDGLRAMQENIYKRMDEMGTPDPNAGKMLVFTFRNGKVAQAKTLEDIHRHLDWANNKWGGTIPLKSMEIRYTK